MNKLLIIIIVGLAAVVAVFVLRAPREDTDQTPGYLDTLGGALKQAKEINQAGSTFDLSNQGLTRLTTEFFEGKARVRVFSVAHNKLTGALPAEIRKMAALEVLNASDNELTGIPAEIGQLDYIREIDFSGNRIDTFPNEFANIADTLKILRLTGNTFSEDTIGQLRLLLPNTQVVY